jgi:hypothetical protein
MLSAGSVHESRSLTGQEVYLHEGYWLQSGFESAAGPMWRAACDQLGRMLSAVGASDTVGVTSSCTAAAVAAAAAPFEQPAVRRSSGFVTGSACRSLNFHGRS